MRKDNALWGDVAIMKAKLTKEIMMLKATVEENHRFAQGQFAGIHSCIHKIHMGLEKTEKVEAASRPRGCLTCGYALPESECPETEKEPCGVGNGYRLWIPAPKTVDKPKTGPLGQILDKEVAVTMVRCKCGQVHRVPRGCSCGRVVGEKAKATHETEDDNRSQDIV